MVSITCGWVWANVVYAHHHQNKNHELILKGTIRVVLAVVQIIETFAASMINNTQWRLQYH